MPRELAWVADFIRESNSSRLETVKIGGSAAERRHTTRKAWEGASVAGLLSETGGLETWRKGGIGSGKRYA